MKMTPEDVNGTGPPAPTTVDNSLWDLLMAVFNLYIPAITITLGVVGNTMTFITMTQSIRQKRNVLMSYHFRALAFGDQLLIVLIVFQRWLLSRFPNAMDVAGTFICKEMLYLGFVLFGISVWNVVIISVDRFVAVCFPLRAAQWCTVRRATHMYIFNYVFHFVFSITKLWKEYYVEDLTIHTAVCKSPDYFPPWFDYFELMLYESIVNYLSPLVVLTLNICILHKFRQQKKEMANLTDGNRLKTQDKQEKSLTVMMMVVAFTFFILMAYYPLENILWEFIIPQIKNRYPRAREVSFYFAYYLTTFNQCINFYLYCFVSAGFRKDVIRLFGCKTKKSDS